MTARGATAGQRYCHATAIPKDGIADALALLSMPGSGTQAAGKGSALPSRETGEEGRRKRTPHAHLTGTGTTSTNPSLQYDLPDCLSVVVRTEKVV